MEIDLRSLLTRDLGLHPQACRDRVVVVTGVGRGIDRQIARAFALLGGKVVLAELSTQGQEVEALIRAEGGEASDTQADVASQALAQEADRRRCG